MSFASYEISKLESEVAELREQLTIAKAERDEFERQRDEVMDAMSTALDGWLSNAERIVQQVDTFEAEKAQIDEMRRKYAVGRIAKWQELTDEQRLEFLNSLPCCRHCGSLDVGCQCWNDE